MKTILLIICLTAGSYCSGFQEGFADGYCGTDRYCIAPVPPPCPTPMAGQTSEHDGYIRGFLLGEEWRKNN